jgi:hypothetical protein
MYSLFSCIRKSIFRYKLLDSVSLACRDTGTNSNFFQEKGMNVKS